MPTDAMTTPIASFSAASVATVNEDGTPSVSPKTTVAIINERTPVFGNIRSPGYDIGLTKDELCATNRQKLNAIE